MSDRSNVRSIFAANNYTHCTRHKNENVVVALSNCLYCSAPSLLNGTTLRQPRQTDKLSRYILPRLIIRTPSSKHLRPLLTAIPPPRPLQSVLGIPCKRSPSP